MPADQPEWLPPRLRQIGERVRDAREEANLTQERLAERAGLSRSTVQRVEGGGTDVRLSHLLMIARALRMPVTDLFS